jgi:ribosome-associated translation inhibitor RaiA
MNIDIQARNFNLTGSILREVEKRIGYTLGNRYDKIEHITVRLGDINGPKGGNDKSCRIRVAIPGQKDVFVEDIEADLYTAIHRAADRANRTVARRLARERQRAIRTWKRPIEDEHVVQYN